MDWIIENKDWLFSGVAIVAIGAIVRWFKGNNSTPTNKQVQKGGDSSTNIQVGGSLNIRNKNDDE